MSIDNNFRSAPATAKLCEEIQRLISTGQPSVAFELARDAAEHQPENALLQYLHALALARGGNIVHADKYIKLLLGRADLAPDIRFDALSLSARVCKGHYALAGETKAGLVYARQSADLYSMAYRMSGNPFPGINAATMTLLSGGDAVLVKELAAEVFTYCMGQIDRSEDNLWTFATIGEACLLLGDAVPGGAKDDANAERWYQLAVDAAGDKIGDIAAMRRQLTLLQKKLDIPARILDLLNGGNVGVFSGHMIDHPDRLADGGQPRFPADPQLESQVAAEISSVINKLDIREGYVSAACGSDLLFAECMIKMGRRVHVVLPFKLDDFYERSVDFGLNDEYWQMWRSRCDRIISSVGDSVHYATMERDSGVNLLYEFLNEFVQGLAILRATELNVPAWSVVVEDKSSRSLPGGAGHFAQLWNSKGNEFKKHFYRIELDSLRKNTGLQSDQHQPAAVKTHKVPSSRAAPSALATAQIDLRSMLFADVKGFSALSEDQAKIFFIIFLDKIAQLLSQLEDKPVFQNTWGDGLFFVFRGPAECAEFGIALVEMAESTDFESLGLPKDLSIRVGIHTGPVFVLPDPIIGKKNVFGANVNRAARIEPVTLPGCVYASEQMAAALAASQSENLTLEYIGMANLAKGYDRCRLYRVARR